MNLSMKWLSDYVDIDVTPKQFSDDMTMSGSKVEGYADETAEIKNVVVGKLLSVEPHPNADHLVVCKVDVGEGAPIQICTPRMSRPVILCPLPRTALPCPAAYPSTRVSCAVRRATVCSAPWANWA